MIHLNAPHHWPEGCEPFIIQPGAQMLVNPGGSPSTPSALDLSVNAVVSF